MIHSALPAMTGGRRCPGNHCAGNDEIRQSVEHHVGQGTCIRPLMTKLESEHEVTNFSTMLGDTDDGDGQQSTRR